MAILISLLVLLVHGGGLVAAGHAVIHTRTPQGAFAWALGLLFLPWLTLLPYLFLGRQHFAGYVAHHRRHRRELARAEPPDAGPAPAECRPYLALGEMLDTRFHSGQELDLLVDGEATFKAIFEAIAAARHSLLVQFFILREDSIGVRLRDLLLERAAAGVQVCVLFDRIGCHGLRRRYIQSLRTGGVAIHAFSTRRYRNRFQLNFRNHRKIVVVDGQTGFVGGLNVGDDYLGRSPPLAPWRDTHLQIRGPAVAELQRSFAEDWHWATGELPPLAPAPAGRGQAHVLVAATGPADLQESGSLFFVTAINAACRRLWLATPYFVPDQAVTAALRLAVFRGVDVRVLIPGRADHHAVFLASSLHARDAVAAGMRVFRYEPGFMHQKVLLVDDAAAAIGSMNLDNRSLRLNFEITALCVDPVFACKVEAMLKADFGRAREIDDSEYARAPWLRRLAMHVARLFDPVL